VPIPKRAAPDTHVLAAGEVQSGFELARAGRFHDARARYERALMLEPENVLAHAALYEIAQIERDVPRALEHQRRMLERQTLFVERAPQERRRLLVLLAPGDWQANVPIDFLIDPAVTTLVKLWIADPAQAPPVELPACDAVFTAIAQSQPNTPYLRTAAAFVRKLQLPAINLPERIAATERVSVWEKLRAVPDVIVPLTRRVLRAELANAQLDYPSVVRPLDSQGGADFEMLEDANELRAYLSRVAAPAFYTMPFVDYRSADGYYRKYRITVIDGHAFPFHLAISTQWMVHFYTSLMREHQWMRDEELRFLANFESVFPARLQRAMRGIACALGLEYFSIDCSIDAQGNLVVFEADPAMIIHAMDRTGMFSYRLPYARRIFEAFASLVDRRAASHSEIP
jgi:glutathione synthase/RimK-type ligase-like ATP-grasp enzyme